MPDDLAPNLLHKLHAWWRSANYLSIGQIYLQVNPPLETPPSQYQVKRRLLGHWGSTLGLNLVYAHLNGLIKARDLDMWLVVGPGHGGPGIVANTYLEGAYSEHYPAIERGRSGMRRHSRIRRPLVRAIICDALRWFGVAPDPDRNQHRHGSINAEASHCKLRALPPKGDAQIARRTACLVQDVRR
jgi:hypothetical protein